MRKVLVFLIAMTLGAALPAAAQLPDAELPCEAPCPMDCCDCGAGTADCAVAHCIGTGSVVLVTAAPECARIAHGSGAVPAALAPLVALPGRAPDTAPPKAFV